MDRYDAFVIVERFIRFCIRRMAMTSENESSIDKKHNSIQDLDQKYIRIIYSDGTIRQSKT